MFALLSRVAGPLLAAAVLVIPSVSLADTRDVVEFSGVEPGTIVVMTSERQLYFTIDALTRFDFRLGLAAPV